MFRKKKMTPEELKTRLQVTENRLTQNETKARRKADEARTHAKEALRKGDDRAFRTASRRHTLATRQGDMVSGMVEMAGGYSDLVDTQMAMTEILDLGQDLQRFERHMGFDDSKLQEAMTHVRTGMERVNQASGLVTSTMEAVAFEGADPETAEALKAELLAELQSETGSETAKTNEIRRAAGLEQSG